MALLFLGGSSWSLMANQKIKFMQICGSFVATRHNQFIQYIAYDIIVSIIRGVTTEVIQ